MPNLYTYRIISLKKTNEVYQDIIKSFVIEITAIDGSDQISKEYKINLENPSEFELNFISFQDLQEQDLVDWFENDAPQKRIATDDINLKLKEHIQETVTSNFPWS